MFLFQQIMFIKEGKVRTSYSCNQSVVLYQRHSDKQLDLLPQIRECRDLLSNTRKNENIWPLIASQRLARCQFAPVVLSRPQIPLQKKK